MVEHETFQFVESRAKVTDSLLCAQICSDYMGKAAYSFYSVLSFACSASTTTSNRKKLQKPKHKTCKASNRFISMVFFLEQEIV